MLDTSILPLKKNIYLFLEREEGREREGNINVWLLLCAPHWGPGPQPRHVSWPGTEPVTLWFAGWCSHHWAKPARAEWHLFYILTCHYHMDLFGGSVLFRWFYCLFFGPCIGATSLISDSASTFSMLIFPRTFLSLDICFSIWILESVHLV